VKSTDTYSTDTAIKLTHELHGLTDASALPKWNTKQCRNIKLRRMKYIHSSLDWCLTEPVCFLSSSEMWFYSWSS